MVNYSVKIKIKSLYREMSSTDKLISDYVLKNIKNVSRSTISDISNELNIADSTFFQFTRKLGYKGFKDFKIALLTENFDPGISIHEKISKKDNEILMVHKVFDSSIRSIEDTRKLIDDNVFNQTISILTESSSVTFYGLGGSNAVAFDSYHKYLRSPLKVNYASDFHIQLMNASLSSENDCAFIISHTGLSKETIEIAQLLKENNSKIIVLTSYPLSPLAKLADTVLVTSSEETAYRSESLSSRLSQLCIIDALFVTIMFKKEKKAKLSLSKIRDAISVTKE